MSLQVSERRQLRPGLEVCPVLNGLWQVSGGHGRIDREAAIAAMLRLHAAGFVTWDLADHYGPAEDFIGEFRRRLLAEQGEAALRASQAFTKWVPRPGPMSHAVVEAAIDRSLRRMGVETLDLLQFHWWDYEDDRYLEALGQLARLRDAGKIRHLALTNFDTERLRRIVAAGIEVVSNQVQYSLVDRRPEVAMAAFCREHGISLLTYGTICGGLLSERYLGRPQPGRGELDTVSLQKYMQMVDAWGGWPLFQELLAEVNRVARQHNASIANVATRYILDRPAVGGVIVGVRLGLSDHLEDNARVFDLELSPGDIAAIEAVLAQGNDLFRLIGDCGDEYR